MACPNESTNGIVIECQDCIAKLEDCIKSDTERSIEGKWNGSDLESLAYTNASRNGEIAGYEWIIYKITGEHYSNFDDDAKYDYPPDGYDYKCINGIIERDEFGNPTKTIFDKEKV